MNIQARRGRQFRKTEMWSTTSGWTPTSTKRSKVKDGSGVEVRTDSGGDSVGLFATRAFKAGSTVVSSLSDAFVFPPRFPLLLNFILSKEVVCGSGVQPALRPLQMRANPRSQLVVPAKSCTSTASAVASVYHFHCTCGVGVVCLDSTGAAAAEHRQSLGDLIRSLQFIPSFPSMLNMLIPLPSHLL